MKKKIRNINPLGVVDAEKSCRSGQGASTCVFLIVTPNGWSCARTNYVTYSNALVVLESDTFISKGQGAWVECQLKTTSQKEK